MSEPTWIQVRLGDSRVRVPVVDDPATTQKIADRCTRLLKQIEEDSSRIDTLNFFQLATFQLAASVHRLEAEMQHDESEILRALEQMQAKLRQLLDEFHPEDSPAILPIQDPDSKT